MKARYSKATEGAFFSSLGLFHIGYFLLGTGFLFLAIVQPNLNDPGTYWAIGLGALLMIVGGVLIIGNAGRRWLQVRQSAKEDRRRIQEGRPRERDDPPEATPGNQA